MENTHTISKSFKLNAIWLNLLILIRELYQAYYRVFIPAALTLKGKSLKQAKEVYFEKQKTMSSKQKTGYTFIINISVILVFFILKVWLTK